jgi:hypothetical protein
MINDFISSKINDRFSYLSSKDNIQVAIYQALWQNMSICVFAQPIDILLMIINSERESERTC